MKRQTAAVGHNQLLLFGYHLLVVALGLDFGSDLIHHYTLFRPYHVVSKER